MNYRPNVKLFHIFSIRLGIAIRSAYFV